MSRTMSYKGTLAMGLEERIRLATIKGKVGYKITKFQIISTAPGTIVSELVGKITKVKDPNIGPTIKFTDADLLAVAYVKESISTSGGMNQIIIFDNEKFNQDIFVNITDAAGETTPANYYIELEAMPLSDLQSTQLTLKSLRTITS
tara:strand:+ start:1337 stop:1777 length:441 start_codon:yes stop_codon:yes gene_type:complete